MLKLSKKHLHGFENIGFGGIFWIKKINLVDKNYGKGLKPLTELGYPTSGFVHWQWEGC